MLDNTRCMKKYVCVCHLASSKIHVKIENGKNSGAEKGQKKKAAKQGGRLHKGGKETKNRL